MFEAATKVCKPVALCQNLGFGLENAKPRLIGFGFTWPYSECEGP